MKTFEANGVARIAWKLRWEGIAERFGFDPNEEKWREERVRITAKTISTRYDRYDRTTGRDRTRTSPGRKPHRVLAYKLDGQNWIECASPSGGK